MNNNLVGNVLKLIGLFIIGSIAISMIVSVVGTLLWLALKIVIPLAIAVWLVHLISSPQKKCRRYY
ncbi:hypothetical protein [Candidatus Enterococcus clewellii]|uniref:Uncharacterized protein n=1 Tax=Candidatus Enterococcus clewellii TaxID=1834193 RepID=A0A242K7R8_9ENTE|nr:hypothetical protein [Enterococcus sp. 9E7_DIV0242]OTP17214.1 hypothetical protein A5888_001352 [Enterococcus sp. 9E7_DIV0242]